MWARMTPTLWCALTVAFLVALAWSWFIATKIESERTDDDFEKENN